MKVIAGIVTYNPELERFCKDVEAIVSQVDEVVIYDNHSDNITELEACIRAYPGVILFKNKANTGIASAFNNIITYCCDRKIHWVLLLDQDSVCPEKLVTCFQKYIHRPKVAVIAPLVIDKRRAPKKADHKRVTEEVKNCVSSGSLINVDICRELGCFEEQLFIDVVDYEYCMRVRLNGYKILQVNNLVLDQEFGNVKVSKHADMYRRLAGKTGITLLNHLAYHPVFSSPRVYYTIRNWVYCIRKYKSFTSMQKEIGKLLKGCAIYMVRGNLRPRLFASIIKGIRSGISMEVKPITKSRCGMKIELM